MDEPSYVTTICSQHSAERPPLVLASLRECVAPSPRFDQFSELRRIDAVIPMAKNLLAVVVSPHPIAWRYS